MFKFVKTSLVPCVESWLGVFVNGANTFKVACKECGFCLVCACVCAIRWAAQRAPRFCWRKWGTPESSHWTDRKPSTPSSSPWSAWSPPNWRSGTSTQDPHHVCDITLNYSERINVTNLYHCPSLISCIIWVSLYSTQLIFSLLKRTSKHSEIRMLNYSINL